MQLLSRKKFEKKFHVYFHSSMLGKHITIAPTITVVPFSIFLGAQPKSTGTENTIQGNRETGSTMLEYAKIKKHVLCHTNVC